MTKQVINTLGVTLSLSRLTPVLTLYTVTTDLKKIHLKSMHHINVLSGNEPPNEEY